MKMGVDHTHIKYLCTVPYFYLYISSFLQVATHQSSSRPPHELEGFWKGLNKGDIRGSKKNCGHF